MNEKPIAEILGWRYGGGTDSWPGRWYHPDGRTSKIMPRITPDDMLAWLLAVGWRLVDAFWVKELPDSFQYHVVLHTLDEWNSATADGPTLHAALEAAVRAVHEADSNKNQQPQFHMGTDGGGDA